MEQQHPGAKWRRGPQACEVHPATLRHETSEGMRAAKRRKNKARGVSPGLVRESAAPEGRKKRLLRDLRGILLRGQKRVVQRFWIIGVELHVPARRTNECVHAAAG